MIDNVLDTPILAPAVTTAGVIQGLVTWLVAPLLLIMLAGFAIWITFKATRSRDRVSHLAALGLGLILLLTVITLHQFALVFEFSAIDVTRSNFWKFLAPGIAAGLILLHLVSQYVRARVGSIFIVLLLSGSLSALYFHFAESTTRMPVFLFVLGLIVGSLIYAMFFPVTFEHLGLIDPEPSRMRR